MEKERNRVEQLVISQDLTTKDMYNKERKLQFIQDIYGNYKDVTDETIISVVKLFNQFGQGETQFGKDLFDMNTGEFIRLFEYFKWSRNSIFQKKSFIKSYLTWGYNHGLIDIQVIRELEEVKNDNVSKRDVFKSYFKTFDDLKNTLNLIIDKRDIVNQREELKMQIMTVKIALYLAWFGVKLKDVCEIRKDQINERHNQIYIESEKTYIDIPEDIMQQVIEYRDLEGFRTKEEIEETIGDSNMLMKSVRKAKLSPTYISTFVSKLLNTEDNDYKIISYQKVYWSGVYFRTHEYEKGNERIRLRDSEILTQMFKEQYNSISRASARLSDYRDYCKHFYPREEFKY